MNSFELLSEKFALHFEKRHFPQEPASLYEANDYFLKLGGKRIRPALVLMGNELFDDIHADAWQVATAIELFHNFTLIHDDIMDRAPLRRGMQTVHEKFGHNTALLGGDVMLVTAYEYLNKVGLKHIHQVFQLFNRTAREVCEGQQLDIDFEKKEYVSHDEYLHMIGLKTSVLLAACLRLGAILGGAGERNQALLYEFGRKLGISYQVQDDYLDAFGDPGKFGKETGGDIKSNKKTFLLIRALETGNPSQQKKLNQLLTSADANKVPEVIKIFKECKVDEWADNLKEDFFAKAMKHLEDTAVVSKRKEPLKELAKFLLQRDY